MSTAAPEPAPSENGAPFTLAGCIEGARLIMPLLPGVAVFAVAFGAAAVAKGLSLGEATAMSAFVYAGLSQMVALEFWRPEWSLPALVGLALVTGAINGRMILQGASLQPWLKPHSTRLNLAQLFLLTDANWLITERYRAGGGRDLGVLVGAGAALWVIWVLATIPGHVAGTLVSDPRRFGLDLLMPVYFSAMLVPMWRGRVNALPWIVAAVVSVASARLMEGYAFVVLGALAGALAGAFGHDE